MGAVSKRPMRYLGCVKANKMLQALAPSAIADLVVVLVKVDEMVGGKAICGATVPPTFETLRVLAVVHIGMFECLV